MESEYLSSLTLLALVLVLPVFRSNIFRELPPTTSKVRTSRIDFFDFLKGVAIVGVVLVHVFFYFDQLYPNANHYWINVLNNLVRYPIGFFFLVSGILLHEEFTSLKSTLQFYKRKLTRIILPYLVANIFIWRISGVSFNEFIVNLATGKASIPYYFVIVLIQLYLLYPLLVKFRTRKWFLPASLLVTYLCYVIADPSPLLGFVFFGKFLFFFCYGIAMRDEFLQFRVARNTKVWIVLSLMYLVTIFIFPGYYFNVRHFYALSLFHLLFIYKDRIEKTNVYKTVTTVGNFSLWIFLSHMSVVSYIFYLTNRFPLNQFVLIGLNMLLTVPLSIVWASVLQKIYVFVSKLVKTSLSTDVVS